MIYTGDKLWGVRRFDPEDQEVHLTPLEIFSYV